MPVEHENGYGVAVTAAEVEEVAKNMYNSQTSAAASEATAASHPSKTSTGHFSEHGHSLAKIRPITRHTGASVAVFLTGLFQTIIALGTLGTSVTFTFMLSNNADLASPEAYYSQKTVQTFLAVSWLLFLLALAFAALGSTLLTFFKAHWIRDWDGEHGEKSQFEVQVYAAFISALLGSLSVGAFIILCLVVVAYTPVVGWIALGFTVWFGLIMLIAVMFQIPWPWRENAPDKMRRAP